MVIEIQAALGMAAGVITIAAFIPYILSILEGKTKPNRASWWIWTVLGIVICASYWSVGARNTFWFTLPVGMAAIALLSLKYGVGGWTPFDRACLGGAAAGLAMWWLFRSPALALFVAIFTDAIGYLPTIRKIYLDPASEDKAAWLMFLAGAVLNLFAIENWTLEIAIYPIYACVFIPVVVLLLFRKPAQSAGAKQ